MTRRERKTLFIIKSWSKILLIITEHKTSNMFCFLISVHGQIAYSWKIVVSHLIRTRWKTENQIKEDCLSIFNTHTHTHSCILKTAISCTPATATRLQSSRWYASALVHAWCVWKFHLTTYSTEHKIRCATKSRVSLILPEVYFSCFLTVPARNGCSYTAPWQQAPRKELNDPLTHTQTHVPPPIQDVSSLTPRGSLWLSSFNLTNGFNLTPLPLSYHSLSRPLFPWINASDQYWQKRFTSSRITETESERQLCVGAEWWSIQLLKRGREFRVSC